MQDVTKKILYVVPMLFSRLCPCKTQGEEKTANRRALTIWSCTRSLVDSPVWQSQMVSTTSSSRDFAGFGRWGLVDDGVGREVDVVEWMGGLRDGAELGLVSERVSPWAAPLPAPGGGEAGRGFSWMGESTWWGSVVCTSPPA